MKPEDLAKRLQEDCGEHLQSVILYGSAAAGDHTGKRSDYNVLVVTDSLARNVLDALGPAARAWTRHGNPPPMMFTAERLTEAADVFPIELLDMQEIHRVLYGPDLLKDIHVSTRNLRLEIEHELRGKLIQLRERYLTARNDKASVQLMIGSLSTFQVLFRAALRLYQDKVPAAKQQAVQELAERLSFNAGPFEIVDTLKRGMQKPRDVEPGSLFDGYLGAIETVLDSVDELLPTEANASQKEINHA